ncbi:MAG: MFS transporter [Candidatus Shapirobacteria bacterium]
MFKKRPEKFWSLKANPIVRVLTISDIFLISSLGLLSPIFAVFLTENIKGGSLQVVGLASTIFLLTKSLAQIPLARIADCIRGEKDDFWMAFIGSLLTSLVPLLYLFASTAGQIYFIQFFYGLSQALTFPSWMAIFTRHIDRHKEGTQWGVYYTLIDLFSALSAGAGGFIAFRLGFRPLFVLIALLSFIGSFWLLLVKKQIDQKKSFLEKIIS